MPEALRRATVLLETGKRPGGNSRTDWKTILGRGLSSSLSCLHNYGVNVAGGEVQDQQKLLHI